jgi:hypothetical protein
MKYFSIFILILCSTALRGQELDAFHKGNIISKDIDGLEILGSAEHYEFNLEWNRLSDDKRPRLVSLLNKKSIQYILVNVNHKSYRLLIIDVEKKKSTDDFNAFHPRTRLIDVVVVEGGDYCALYSSIDSFEIRRFSAPKNEGKIEIKMHAIIPVNPKWRKTYYNKKSPLISGAEIQSDGVLKVIFDEGDAKIYTFNKDKNTAVCNGQATGQVSWPTAAKE